jgi:FkbM family methyltransferase
MDKFVEKNWPGGYIILDTGDFMYVPKAIDNAGHQRLIEPFREEPILKKLCKPGLIVLDVGANLGEWTLVMANGVGAQGRVYSFEPAPFLFDALNKTVAANQFNQVTVSPYALSDESKTKDFYIQYDENELLDARLSRLGFPADLAGLKLKTDAKKAKKIQVKTITLDEFAVKEKLERLDFIKIDAEGYENAIVEGGLSVLKKFRPNLILECGGVFDSEEKRKKMITRLRELDYSLLGLPGLSGIIEVTWEQYINLSFPMIPERAVNLLFVQRPRT